MQSCSPHTARSAPRPLNNIARWRPLIATAPGITTSARTSQALLAAIAGAPPYHVLDLGCGPGRDLVTFRDLGHVVVGLDGCPDFVAMARAVSGCEVWQQDMLAMTLSSASFDGVFANAVLFHVPSRAVTSVLGQLHTALKPGGALLASKPAWPGRRGLRRWPLRLLL
jgi:SAM-dependent methyltransferase